MRTAPGNATIDIINYANRDWKWTHFCTLTSAIHVGADTQQWTTIVHFCKYTQHTTRLHQWIYTQHRGTTVLQSYLGHLVFYDCTTNTHQYSLAVNTSTPRTKWQLLCSPYNTSLDHSFLTNSNLVGHYPEMQRKWLTATCYNSKMT